MIGAHIALEAGGGDVWMGEQAVARGTADEHGAVITIAHGGGRHHLTQSIGNEFWPVCLEDRHKRIGRAKVYADDGFAGHTVFAPREYS